MNLLDIKNKEIPDCPGVYIFRDSAGKPLYIGRATSLRNRVRSYFDVDLIETRGPRVVDMITKSQDVSWEVTDSVLEAIFLEAQQIKKYQTIYNIDEKDDKSALYVVITDEDWPRIFTVRGRDLEKSKESSSVKIPKLKKEFGPFYNSGIVLEALRMLRKIFPFRDKRSLDPRHEAFYKALGMSPDSDDSTKRDEYMNTIRNLSLIFSGRKADLRKKLNTEMYTLANELQFERAERIKKLLYAIDHINDVALIKRETENGDREFRIEAYDVAHMGGKEVVGAMVLCIGINPDKSGYRKFKVSVDENNDVKALSEILNRRLDHTEWQYPDVIVVDGGKAQLNTAQKVLSARRISIPVVAVTKNDKHKPEYIIGNSSIIKKHKDSILVANAESHRFALAYQRTRRNFKVWPRGQTS